METASRHSSAAVGSRVFLGMDDESRRATVGSLIATKRGTTRSRLWKRLRRCWRRAPDEEKASVGAGNPECSRAPVPNTGVHLCRLGRPVDTTNFRTAKRLSFYFYFTSLPHFSNELPCLVVLCSLRQFFSLSPISCPVQVAKCSKHGVTLSSTHTDSYFNFQRLTLPFLQ